MPGHPGTPARRTRGGRAPSRAARWCRRRCAAARSPTGDAGAARAGSAGPRRRGSHRRPIRPRCATDPARPRRSAGRRPVRRPVRPRPRARSRSRAATSSGVRSTQRSSTTVTAAGGAGRQRGECPPDAVQAAFDAFFLVARRDDDAEAAVMRWVGVTDASARAAGSPRRRARPATSNSGSVLDHPVGGDRVPRCLGRPAPPVHDARRPRPVPARPAVGRRVASTCGIVEVVEDLAEHRQVDRAVGHRGGQRRSRRPRRRAWRACRSLRAAHRVRDRVGGEERSHRAASSTVSSPVPHPGSNAVPVALPGQAGQQRLPACGARTRSRTARGRCRPRRARRSARSAPRSARLPEHQVGLAVDVVEQTGGQDRGRPVRARARPAR